MVGKEEGGKKAAQRKAGEFEGRSSMGDYRRRTNCSDEAGEVRGARRNQTMHKQRSIITSPVSQTRKKRSPTERELSIVHAQGGKKTIETRERWQVLA